jgi:hypothetical protein
VGNFSLLRNPVEKIVGVISMLKGLFDWKDVVLLVLIVFLLLLIQFGIRGD